MNVKPQARFEPCVPGSFSGGLSRASYFDGMVLSESDMRREQDYWRMKRKLTNRALGNGVVWGLTMEWSDKKRSFTLCPGYALSCCGDDLIVECPETISERALIDPCSETFRNMLKNKLDPCNCDPDPQGPIDACLMLEYVECPEEPRELFEDPCAELAEGCRYGSIRETTRLCLVPPPPPPDDSPIEQFCKKISMLKQDLAEAGVEISVPVLGEVRPDAIFSVTQFEADTAQSSAVAELNASSATETIELDLDASTDSIRLGIEPPPGYYFAHATIDGTELPVAEAFLGVFTRRILGHADTNRSNVIELEITPLFSRAQSIAVRYTLDVSVSATNANMMSFTATVDERKPGQLRGDCTTILTEGLVFSGDAGCTLRTLALATLCGWFIGALSPAPCTDPEVEPETERTLFAWLICSVAWRLLFGIDVRDPKTAGVHACLKQLFKDWCEGFHYPGPRCDSDQHGVILGCVKVSPKGRILCFDPWKHRRHVLTGAIVSHWQKQVGMNPLDVTVSRLAGWICCVSKANLTDDSLAAIASMDALLPLAGGALALGSNPSEFDRLKGMEINAGRNLTTLELVQRLIGMLTATEADGLSGATALSSNTVPGTDLHLLSTRGNFLRDRAEPIALDHSIELKELPVMARQPAHAFVEILSKELALASLKDDESSEHFSTVVSLLNDAGINTAADLLKSGPKNSLHRIREPLAIQIDSEDDLVLQKAIGVVYADVVTTLESAGNAIGEVAREKQAGDPFVSADLTERTTLSAINTATNKHLKSREKLNQARTRELANRALV